MQIIRFVDSAGRIRLGTDHREGSARLLAGDLLSGPTPLEERERVVRLLAPLEPAAIFGIGLNSL